VGSMVRFATTPLPRTLFVPMGYVCEAGFLIRLGWAVGAILFPHPAVSARNLVAAPPLSRNRSVLGTLAQKSKSWFQEESSLFSVNPSRVLSPLPALR